MIDDIIKIAIGFVFTGILGSKISSKIQRKNFLNQTKISKTEKDVEKIKELTKKIELLSGARNYAVRILSSSLHLRGNDEKRLDEIRKEYRETVKEWNINITTIYTELFSLNLYSHAIKLEEDVHNIFRESHILINDCIKNNSLTKATEINELADKIFKNTRDISSNLINEGKSRWAKTINGNTEKLCIYNVQYATLFTLIIALFHRTPKSLRVKRPNLD
ncbi:TPA: hypothetical protein QH822_005249 [Klebsiella quasipneumoniae subsp. similipneumoniae]|nr:hypothetical protein [Klebsiella quasipneumoniae subsp. similipneumoniae]